MPAAPGLVRIIQYLPTDIRYVKPDILDPQRSIMKDRHCVSYRAGPG